MKNKSYILGVILVLVVILMGIGIGYFLTDNKKILVEIENANDEYKSCISIKINGKDVTEEIIGESDEYSEICEYEIYNNLAIITINDAASNEWLYIYNNKAERLFAIKDDFPSDLLLYNWELDKENSKINFYSELRNETGGVADRVYDITGKELYELSCNELEFYKDKIVALETHELKLKKNSLATIVLVDKKYLENYVDEFGYNHYEDLMSQCES